ncbi:MAG: VOC family protein [Bilifractor sp.]
MLTQFTNGEIQHIGIPAANIDETAAFFLKLGFRLKWEINYNGFPVKFFEYGNILIETYEKEGGTAGIRGAIDHIALNCIDIVGCVNKAREEKMNIVEGPCFLPYWEHGVEYVCIEGPNKEIIEFIQKFKSEDEAREAVSKLG